MKKALSLVLLILVSISVLSFSWSSQEASSQKVSPIVPPDDRAVNYLAKVMDQFHTSFDVYTEADAAGNHFVVRPRMSNYDNSCRPADAERTVPAMDEAWLDRPHSGLTCIKASFKSEEVKGEFNWGAWYFMNGIQQDPPRERKPGKEKCPRTTRVSQKREGALVIPEPNWGIYPDAGVNLTGATKLTFWARGEKGGERVEFFALGVGWNPDRKDSQGNDVRAEIPGTHEVFPHPDSSRKVTNGFVTLTREWKQYGLDLKGRDLSYVLGGFGWGTSATHNGLNDITFYLDDIRYEYNKAGIDTRLNAPRFLVSYETRVPSPDCRRCQDSKATCDFNMVMRNAAHTYDNALALIAFLAAGDLRRAKLIADAFVFAQRNDRFQTQNSNLADIYRGSLRSAYQGGDLSLPPGWIPGGRSGTARMPGWHDKDKDAWFEDRYSVGLDAGNIAWAMLALVAYHQTVVKTGASDYLLAAKELGEWVERHCHSDRGKGGFTGGFQGWEPNPEPAKYKATEHNIDLYAAFQRLYLITREEKWSQRANHAARFVRAMWDAGEGKFWTGTNEIDNQDRINQEVIPLDIQAWAVLSLNDEELLSTSDREKALDYVEKHMRLREGYDYSRKLSRKLGRYQDREGIWYEGTAQMAVAYQYLGEQEKSRELVRLLESAQVGLNGLPASNQECGLRTGFPHPDADNGNRYFKRAHVGATAWLVLAQRNVNPFWMGVPRF
jgi:hypothetical protein